MGFGEVPRWRARNLWTPSYSRCFLSVPNVVAPLPKQFSRFVDRTARTPSCTCSHVSAAAQLSQLQLQQGIESVSLSHDGADSVMDSRLRGQAPSVLRLQAPAVTRSATAARSKSVPSALARRVRGLLSSALGNGDG
jgi:hypothetical protein